MLSEPLSGVWPALVTPLTSDGRRIDEAALRTHVDFCVEAGVSGVVACGGTGEANYLSASERQQVTAVVADQVAGRVGVIVNAGGVNTGEAVALAEHGAAAGADAIMLGLPYGEALGVDQACGYFSSVAGAVELPLVAYNYPAGTGTNLEPDFLQRLLDETPAVRYLKDSGGSIVQQYEVVRRFGDRLPVFAGYDWQSAPALALGVAGLITGGMNAFPSIYARMFSAASSGDPALATAQWLRLMPFAAFLEAHPFVSSVKHACRMVGVPVGPVRTPGEELGHGAVRELREIIRAIVDGAPGTTVG